MAGAWLIGCGSPPPSPPTAVIDAEPSTVCLNDDFATSIRLDASRSAPGLTLVPVPPAEAELTFYWSFGGAAVKELSSDPEVGEMLVATAGDRPLHVTLRVRHQGGGEATTLRTLPITLPDVAACTGDGDCGERRCSQGACVPRDECLYDAECPACFICDAPAKTCRPVETTP